MLERSVFEVLEYIECHPEITYNDLLVELKDCLKSTLNEVVHKKYICIQDNKVKLLEKGYAALEPYRVQRVIYIAAGTGSRLRPYTNDIPKPLVQVGNKSMIETTLEAMVQIGINDIIVVRGYLKDQFDMLLDKYPNIKFIDNDYYENYNNIYSAYLVTPFLENTYILDADLVLNNKQLIKKYQYKTNYVGKFRADTDDWCLEKQKDNFFRMKFGGRDCYLMYGLSYWSREDGRQLAKDIIHEVETNGQTQRYWDEVALNLYDRSIEVRVCGEEDIIEIDTVQELEMYRNLEKGIWV